MYIYIYTYNYIHSKKRAANPSCDDVEQFRGSLAFVHIGSAMLAKHDKGLIKAYDIEILKYDIQY